MQGLLDYFRNSQGVPGGMLYNSPIGAGMNGDPMASMPDNASQATDPRQKAMIQQGLLGAVTSLLNSSGYSRMPVSTGQRLGGALQGFQEGMYNKAPAEAAAANLDLQSKGNIFATQILSAASATGDQAAYDKAKNQLSKSGIDLSAWAPDVKTGAQQAQAARLAQSPLGSLLNAGLKQDSNNIALAGLTGTLPNGNAATNLGGVNLPSFLPAGQNQPNPASPQNAALNNSASQTPAEAAAASLHTGAIPPQANSQFAPPAQLPNETMQAYKQRYDRAFEAYKESPAAIRQKSAATDQGKTDVANAEAANKAQELTDRLTQNLTAMSKLNDSVPQSGILSSSNHAYISRALQANGLGKGEDAKAFEQWNQIDNQQVLTEIQQFIASGGANARVNQTLEKIAKAASSISPESSPETRKALINNALAELKNKNIGVQNLVKSNQGKSPDSYVPIPVSTTGGAGQPIDYQEFFK